MFSIIFTEVSAFFLIRSASSALVSKFVDLTVELIFVDFRCLLLIASLLDLIEGELIFQDIYS